VNHRSLQTIGTSAIFLGIVARLLWSANDFVLGFAVALQISGTAILAFWIVTCFIHRPATRDAGPAPELRAPSEHTHQ
jgi:hypothetical protein